MPTIQQSIYLCALVFPQPSIALLSGGLEVANPQSWEVEVVGVGDGTVRKSVGEFL